MAIFLRIIEALWFILPAYIANSSPVYIAKIPFLKKYSKPVDFGKSFQKVRIFGDNKTWRGLFLGIFLGTVTAIIQVYFQKDATKFFFPAILPNMTLELGFMLAFGALIGDLAGSFVKRRVGFKSGEHAPLMDQLNFVFGSFLFAYLLTFTINYEIWFTVILMTPTIHLLFNFIAWSNKMKKNPW